MIEVSGTRHGYVQERHVWMVLKSGFWQTDVQQKIHLKQCVTVYEHMCGLKFWVL